MALRQVVIVKKLEALRAKLAGFEDNGKGFEERKAALKLREAELEAAVNEITDDTPDDDRTAVEESISAFEAEQAALEAEEAANNDEKAKVEQEIEALQNELEGLNKKSAPPVAAAETKRKDEIEMDNRKFFGMSYEQRDAFFARQDVKDFLCRVREMGGQKRAVTGAELLIPTVMLGLIRENINSYSKLISKVNLRSVPGKARQRIMGAIPEAVWTEMCATLNELNLVFNQVEVDGYKVGGYIAICNAVLEDSDIALGSEIISAIGQGIGYALDKAIIYGTGTKMPLGFVTRLAQTEAPADYPANARPWANLSTTNILSVTSANSTGSKLFQSFIKSVGAAKGKYSRGAKFWAMNDATYNTLLAEALSINAAGAIVSGQNNTMPVIGGEIVLLDFIPDNNIVGGYGDLYLLAERAGTSLAQSEHVRFIEDQTVFKGTARYDGTPVIPEGFVAVGINGVTPTTSMTFAEDKANVTV